MKPRLQYTCGFTLVELMFSMAIGSIILLLAASILGTSGTGYERVGGNVASEREARGLITQLASDLSTARFHKDELLGRSSSAWPVDKLGFLTLQPSQAQSDANRIGDLCTVNYYTKDLVIGGKTVRCLMRGFTESKITFEAVRKNTVATLFGPARTLGDPGLDEPIAFGVISFEARPKSRDSSGKWIDWVKNDTKAPEGIDLKLVVARRDLAAKLKTSSDWDGANGATSKLVGAAAKAETNANLKVYATILRFGNYVSP